MKQLKRLWLGAGKKNGNEITDDGLEFLSGLSQLEQLELQFSKVTDEGFEELKEKLPALTTNQ